MTEPNNSNQKHPALSCENQLTKKKGFQASPFKENYQKKSQNFERCPLPKPIQNPKSKIQNPMTRLKKTQGRPWSLLSQRSLLVGLGCITGLGLLSGRVIGADEFSIPIDAEPALAPVEAETWEPSPVDTYDTDIGVSNYAEPAPEYYEAPEEVYSAPEPAPEYYEAPEEAYSAPEPAPEIPNVVPPPSQEIVLPEQPGFAEGLSPVSPDSSANTYIDPTEYSIGATESYESPNTVVFSERSTGCEAVVELGQAVNGLCGPAPSESFYARDTQPPSLSTSGGTVYGNGVVSPNGIPGGSNGFVQPNSPIYPASNAVASTDPNGSYWQPQSESSWYGGGSSEAVPVTGFSPIQGGPINLGSISSSGLTYYSRTMRPPSIPGNGDSHPLFPLTIPAPITSLFGWRMHPVMGYGRFHTGIDLGADEGTPVVASYSGQVTIADWLGGYGITVVLDHREKAHETLYGHLSELFVKPGEWVKQGEVIGRVGNTGMSTGPHLHFEMRKLTDQGWVAIDPGSHIEYALAQLLNTMRATEVPSSAFIAKLPENIKDEETGKPKLPPLPPGVDIIIPQLEPPTVNFGFKENVKNKG